MISSPEKAKVLAAALLLGGALACERAVGQDFSLRVAESDWVFGDGVLAEGWRGMLDPAFLGGVKGDVGLSLSGAASYDSNINLSSEGGEEDDVIFSLTPSIFYTSDPEGGAMWVAAAYYAPSYQTYMEQRELGRLNHSGGVSLRTSGARTTLSGFFNLAQASGADRLTEGYSEATILTTGLAATYELAPRTSVFARFSYGTSSYATDQEGSDRHSLQVGGRWAATELLKIGPALRYSRVVSDGTGTRTAIGALMHVSYVASERMDLSCSFGFEAVENSRSSGSSQVRATGDLRLSYMIDERWSSRASIRYANVPSPASRNYLVNDLTFQAALTRTLTYGSLSAGASYGIEEYQEVGPVSRELRSEDFMSVFLSYQRPVLDDRAGFFSSINYSRSEGNREWSRWMLSTGLSIQF
jgi:hypothetical protein